MSVLTAWLVVGLPALVIALALFVGRSPVRSLAGYAVLAAAFAVMVVVDRVSAAAFGGVLALLYAAGRGGTMERERDDADPAVGTAGGR